ncbi:UNVERIFIED_CONTAM: hypothetical protein FKN15_014184 [Acipenser sinensis]
MATCYKKTAALQLVVGVQRRNGRTERRRATREEIKKRIPGPVTATAQPDLGSYYL